MRQVSQLCPLGRCNTLPSSAALAPQVPDSYSLPMLASACLLPCQLFVRFNALRQVCNSTDSQTPLVVAPDPAPQLLLGSMAWLEA